MALFSTTGIRGIANQDMNSEFALHLGRTFGTLIGQGRKILVGMDTRTSSEMLKNSVIAGLLESGCNVFDTEIAPIPVINFAVKQGYDAGLMVTSSHNPPEYNGIKFILKDGTEISTKQEKKFESIYLKRKFKKVPWQRMGKYALHNVLQDYEGAVLSLLKNKNLNLKVVLDLGNGSQAFLIPDLLNRLNCETILLHEKTNGLFERSPEPRMDTLSKLRETVLNENADFGVAFDTDGDRAIFCTDAGEILMGDITGCLLAGEILKQRKNSTIVTTIATSSLIDDITAKYNGKLIKTRVGGKLVGSVLMKKKAVFGFEENGGCMFPEISPARDGALTAVKIAELISSRGKKLSEILKELPKYYQLKARVPVPENKKKYLLNSIKNKIKRDKAKKISAIDGLKIFFEENSWALIRPSGTEPIFRVFVESKNKKRAEELLEWAVKKVKQSL